MARFARQYVGCTTVIGQDLRDPHTYAVTKFGQFETEEEYAETIRREEAFRDNWRRRAREMVNA